MIRENAEIATGLTPLAMTEEDVGTDASFDIVSDNIIYR